MEQHETGLGPFFHQSEPFPTASDAITPGLATANVMPAPNGGLFSGHCIASSDGPNPNTSTAIYSQSAEAVALVPPVETARKKRWRSRNYATPEEAAAVKAADSAASSFASFASLKSSSKKRDHQLIGSPPSTSSSSMKSQLDSEADTGQCFMPHVINVHPGEDVAQKIRSFMLQSKREFCVLSATGSVCNVSLVQSATSGGCITYDGPFDILSLSCSFVHTDQGERSGGLSACLSARNGQIVGGEIAGSLIAVSLVEVIAATFIIKTKKGDSSGAKGDNSTTTMASPSSVSVSNVGYRPVIESSGGFPLPDHQDMGGFMIPPQDFQHMLPPHSDWRAGLDARNGLTYDFAGQTVHGNYGMHESSENGNYEHLQD